ncbi:MAG TPA: hypothetical protein GXX35_02465 [Thermoanaerobacterales bacterium]|nr:hypothetical protein [Thermoanaerobacterales bacterium]
MWISFRPIKDKELVLRVVDGLVKYRPVKVHKSEDGWIISIKLQYRAA